MFDALLKSKFYTKCKSTIKLTKTRIEMIRKKRDAMLKYLKNDMSDLLKSGVDVNAYSRADGLLFELNISSCYDFLEQYCLHISSHLANMSKQRECPEECREAVSTLMFSAARLSDLPELRELRDIFTERYGNSLECFVNKEFVRKLKSQSPTKDMKLQLMREIAVESGVRWNSKALEHKLSKQLIAVQDLPKSHNDEEHKLHKKMDESPQRKDHHKVKLNHENARTHTSSKAKREHHSSHGRKEVPGDVPKGTESNKQKRDNISRTSNRYLDDKPPVKDTKADITGKNGQQNEPKIIKSVSEEKSDDKTPFYYRPIQPSYNKSRVCLSKISSDASPTASTGETQGNTEMNQRGVKIAKEENSCVNDTIKNQKPKSVRTRLQTMHDCEEDSDKRLRHGKHGTKVANGDHLDQRDEEEKMMDRLLMHYTRKQAQIEVKTAKSVVKLPEVESSEVSRKRSIRVELKQANRPVTLREGHTEANSFEHYDMLSPNGHIHPKLPDYDDLVTRLAALKGN